MKIRIKQSWGFFILAFLIIIYLIIYSLQSVNEESDVTEIYYADMMTAAHRTLINRYNELNKGKIKVIPVDFPNFDFSTNERKEIFARALRNKEDGIDLLAIDVIGVQRFAKWCEPFDNYLTENYTNKILNVALRSSYTNGKLLAIPLYMSQGVMYYRKDLIEKLFPPSVEEKIKKGITWEEFVQLGFEVDTEKNPFYIFPASNYEGVICSFTELILSIDPNYFLEKGFYFNTPEAKKALQFLVDLVQKYKISPPIVTEFTEVPSYAYFLRNNALFLHGWPSYDKDFKGSEYDYLDADQVSKAPIPHFKDGVATSTLGGSSLMMSKFTENKYEVVDFVKFLISEESQEILYKESNYYPVIKKFYEDSTYSKKYPEIDEYRNLIETGVHRPSHVEYTRFSQIMSDYIKKAIDNEISVNEALESITQEIQLYRLIVDEYLD